MTSVTVKDLNQWEADLANAQNSQGASIAQSQYSSALSTGVAAGDTSTPYTPASTYANTPAYQLNPYTTPSAFGITNPKATVFTGYLNETAMQQNQIIGALADKFGINPKGKNVADAVLKHVEKTLGVHAGAVSTKGIGGMQMLTGNNPEVMTILDHLGVDPASGASTNPWFYIAQHFGVTPLQGGTKQTMEMGQVFDNLKSYSTQQIQALQGQLYDAGLMPASTAPGDKKEAITGNWDTPTTDAMGQLLQLTATANAAGHDVKWSDVLGSMIQNSGKGMLALYPQTHPAITVATQEQMVQPAIAAFENRLGRTPTASELAGLTSSFDTQELQHASNVTPGQMLFPDSSNIQQVPGAPTATQAAENYAMTNDPTGYQGHQFANAYAMFMNALVPNKLLGVDPNITSAARPL